MNSKYRLKNLDPINTTFLIATPIFAVILGWLSIELDGFNWSQIILAAIFYILTSISVTSGYHRLFAHRTYKAAWPVRLFFLCFGAASFQNSALKWSSDHRRHHTNCDEEHDPYSIQEGFFHAHMGWVFLRQDKQWVNQYPKDLARDPMLQFQDKYIFAIGVLFGFLLPTYIGYLLGSALQGLALAGLCRIVCLQHTTFFVNSACHMFGTQPYMDDHSAKDSIIMALLTNGEGYHNYHHSFQTDYRNGIRWYHYDPSKWLIFGLSKMGFAWDLKTTSEKRISEAMKQMEFKRRKLKTSSKLVNA